MRRWMVLALSMSLLAACARQPAGDNLGLTGEVESLKGSLAASQAENAQLKQRLEESEGRLRRLQEDMSRVQNASVRKPDAAFYEALTQLVYAYLERGVDLPPGIVGSGELEFGIDLGGKSTVFPRKSVSEVDFNPLRNWFQQHPWTTVRTVSVVPRSHAGYQRVDLVVGDRFYLLFGFQDLRIVKLIVTDHPATFD